MDNLALFTDWFLYYLVTFIKFGAAVVIAVFVGIAIRKNKNKKLENEAEVSSEEKETVAQ